MSENPRMNPSFLGDETIHIDPQRRKRDQIENISRMNKEARENMNLDNENQVGLLLNTKAAFDVQPSEIIFKDVEPGQIYQMTVVVKNLTTSVKRIRVFQPKNSCFRCDYAMLGPIAPGLSIELVVSFESEENGEFIDSITIISDNNIEYEVAISAYSPMAKIIFEPFVNFGFIQAGKSKTQTVLFKNEGSREGSVHILSEDIKDFAIEPKMGFILQKKETKRVNFTYSPKEPGIFRGEVKVETSGKSFIDKIDVNATCVEFLRFIINEEGEELNKIEFGTVLFGQRKKITGHLVNNSPEGFYYRIIYLQGLHMIYKEENNIMTPHEQGVQQTRRLLQVEPSEGYINSYDQVPLTFSCKTWVEEDHQICTRNYAMANKNQIMNGQKDEIEVKEIQESVQSTAVFFFKKSRQIEEQEDNRVLMMQADAICPKVDFSQNIAEFGKVPVGERAEISFQIKNDCKGSEVRISCPKTSVFSISPTEIVLQPNQVGHMSAVFLPKNFGKIVTDIEIAINTKYIIPFRLIGAGTPALEKNLHQSTMKLKGTISEAQLKLTRSESKLTLPPVSSSEIAKNFGQSRMPDYLKEGRNSRLAQKKDILFKEQLSTLESKAKEIMPRYIRGQTDKDAMEDWIANDVKFLFNENREGLDIPRMDIPKAVDSLFVIKPLGKYEPLGKDDPGLFNPDPDQALERLPERAITHAMTREINMALSNEMLKHILAGPKTIDFGRVFIFSRTTKYFHVKNEMKSVIRVRLIKEGEEFEQSDDRIQVIMTGKTAAFPLVFLSKQSIEVNRIMRYIINEKHIFKYIVKAQAILVDLNLSDYKIDLSFADDSLLMSTSKPIFLTNKGNDVANFDWYIPPGAFKVEPENGTVAPNEKKKIMIIYTPMPNGTRPIEEDTLDLRIQHGSNKSLHVIGNAIDTRCDCYPSMINFNSIAVGEAAKLHFTIKNHNQRNAAVYHIDQKSLGHNIKLSQSQMIGKIPAESSVRVDFEFSSKEQVNNLSKSFNVFIRGSKTIVVNYTGNVIIPTVQIHELEYDFKMVTYGNSATLPMTIENTSPIVAKLNLDLRLREDLEGSDQFACLKIVQDKSPGDDSVIEEMDIDPEEERRKKNKALEDEKREILNHDKSLDDIMPSEGSEENDDNLSGFSEVPENNDCFILTLKPKKLYKFILTFTPQFTKKYEFSLPITLNGFDEYTDLQRPIVCRAVHPRIVLDPIDGVRDFKKKTISQIDGITPETQTLKINNPDPVNPVRFYIDTQMMEDSKEFHLSKTEGVVAPRGCLEIIIEFRPTIPKLYDYKLPLYADDEKSVPKAYISLRGESAFPRILFDRHEIIFPVVPIGVESKVQCYIYNDGYQSVNLKGHIIETFQHFPIKVDFPDGPSLNSKRHKVKVELSYTAKYPISFTTQLFIEDDQKNSFWTYISGTSDNSIMTNYGYFQRTPKDEYELLEREDKPLALKLPDKNDLEIASERNITIAGSKASGGTTNKIGLGYQPIPIDTLERSCKHMARLLSTFVPGVEIENFPNEIIAKNGDTLIKVVEYYSQVSLGIKGKFSSDLKKADKVSMTLDHYNSILNFLRREGAYLNNIRPEYLLSWNDLLLFYKKKQSMQVITAASKLGETAHRYLSWDSWIFLLNQILKLYFVNRITLAKFKSITAFPDSSKKLPHGAETSMIFSLSEQILLRWTELCFQKAKDSAVRLHPWSKKFQTGLAYGSLIQFYTSGSWRPLRKMKDEIIQKSEAYENMNVVRETFIDMHLHYIPEFSELASLDPRESILFMTYLFNVLPSYQPKDTLVFECKVDDSATKKVTLQNPHLQLLTYNVMLDGSSDFVIKENQIKIEPKTSQEFYITFNGRISKPMTGKLIFKPKKEGDLLMAPIVYDLKSKITGRYTTEKKVIKDVMLYEYKTQDLKIVNPFTKDCNFNILVEYLPSGSGDANPRRRKLGAGQGKATKTDDSIIPSFFVKMGSISIRKGKQKPMRFYYLPLTFEVHHCNIILVDEDVGELQYEMIGIPMYPAPIQAISISTTLDQIKTQDIPVSILYKSKHQAHALAIKDMDAVKDPKVKAALMQLVQNQKDEETFRIDSTAPKELSYPSHFTIHSPKKLENTQNEGERPTNIIALNIGIRYPVKDYIASLILKNNDLTDIRVYEFVITISPKVFKAIIEFTTPVKIPLEQGIPVTNPTEQEVIFGIKKEDGTNGDYFQVPFSLKVRGLTTESLPVCFNPSWKGEASSMIKLINPATSEEFHYTLKGVGEEPLSENHYQVFCDVGESKQLPLIIENTDHYHKDYTVTIDAYGITGPSKIRVDPGTKATYTATVKPVLGGIYAGCITFTDQNRHFIWYSCEIEYRGKKNVRQLEVQGVIRKDNPLEIEIENTLSESVDYKVMIRGEALSGPTYFTVPGNSKATYELSFFPLRVFSGEGTVVFTNSRVGEILCKVNTLSSEPTPVKLPLMKCEVGKTVEQIISLENPSSKSVRVTMSPFTSDTFGIGEREFEIPPRDIKDVKLIYSPVEIDVQNNIELTFLTENMGSWRYLAFGKGLYPTSYDPKEYVLELQKDSSGTVTFKNPFKTTITVSIRIEAATPAEENIFGLINKKTKVTLSPGTSTQIPISFYPEEIRDYNCAIIVYLNEKISWRYPIRITTESKAKTVEDELKTDCRKKIEKDLSFHLPGLSTVDVEEPYRMELIGVAKGELDVVRKWFTVLNDQAFIDPESHKLKFSVKFYPQKPMKTYGEVLVTRKSGGKWR